MSGEKHSGGIGRRCTKGGKDGRRRTPEEAPPREEGGKEQKGQMRVKKGHSRNEIERDKRRYSWRKGQAGAH